MSNSTPKEYELFYFLTITLAPEEIKTIQQKISGIITKSGGVIIKEEDLGKKKLAFSIKRARHGYYLTAIFKADPAKVTHINKAIGLVPEIIRYRLNIKQNIKNRAPRPLEPNHTPGPEQKNQTNIKKRPAGLAVPDAPTAAKKQIDKVDTLELDKKIDELLSDHGT